MAEAHSLQLTELFWDCPRLWNFRRWPGRRCRYRQRSDEGCIRKINKHQCICEERPETSTSKAVTLPRQIIMTVLDTHLEAIHPYKDNEVVESQALQNSMHGKRRSPWWRSRAKDLSQRKESMCSHAGHNKRKIHHIWVRWASSSSSSSSAASSSTILPRLVVCLVETMLFPDDCCGRGVVIEPRSVRNIASAKLSLVAVWKCWNECLGCHFCGWAWQVDYWWKRLQPSNFCWRAAKDWERLHLSDWSKVLLNRICFGKVVSNHSNLVGASKARCTDDLENSKRIVHLRVDAFRLVWRLAGTAVIDVKAFKDSKFHLPSPRLCRCLSFQQALCFVEFCWWL